MKIAVLTTTLLLIASSLFAQKPLSDGVDDLAAQITSATKAEKQRIAILPFRELEGRPTVFGTYLAEELVTVLFQHERFHIVERQLLDKVMGELRVEQSGAIDPKTAKEVGRLAGVDAIVTGSITDLRTVVAVNCRLIDTTTGEVFGAAHTRIVKDDDVQKIMGLAANSTTTERVQTNLGSQDVGLLRVTVTGVSRVERYRVRCTLELANRDPRRSLLVAVNADPGAGHDERIYGGQPTFLARLMDDGGNAWSTTQLSGLGFVKAGVHGRRGDEPYRASDIARLLRLRDVLGRDSDDPDDGEMDYVTRGEGGSNVTFGPSGITTPKRFFPNTGNTFVYGTMTTIAPGGHLVASMTFARDTAAATASTAVQLTVELVVGVRDDQSSTTYTVEHLSFDSLRLPTQ